MTTISEVVKQIIANSPFLEEGLSQGLINCSALARKIQPEIEIKLYKKIQLSAIVMALNRISNDLYIEQTRTDKLQQVLNHINDISLRSNLTVYTMIRSMSLAEKKMKLAAVLAQNPYGFIEVMEGIYESAFYISEDIDDGFNQIFQTETITSKIDSVSAITVRMPKEAINVPGVYYALLKKIAWNGINIIDIMSSFTEFTIFVDKNNTDKAFSTLKNART